MSEISAADRSWIDAEVKRFELAWKKGPRPQIEHFLAQVDESRWAPLVTELLRVESALRRRAGEEPSWEEYSRRFSQHADLIAIVFGQDPDSTAQKTRDVPAGTDHAASSAVLARVSSRPPELGTHPEYEIVRELGHGGMGVVYLAHNHLIGRDEVLKVIRREIIELPGALDRFLREIRAVGRLQHANIVTAYSAFDTKEGLVFAMEYAEGLDLARMVKAKGPMPVGHASFFIHQAALGLRHAHEKGMVHRDIKPSNLMLSHQGKRAVIKLLDFGLAKASSEQKVIDFRHGGPSLQRESVGHLTRTGQMLGTPDFIAPEQIVDAQKADIRADIYSLGCTMYYLLSGRPPFQAATLHEVLQAHRSMEARFLGLVRPEVPTALAELVAEMMAKDPNSRPQSPAEVSKALMPFFKKSPQASTGANLGATPAPPGGVVQPTHAGLDADFAHTAAAETEPGMDRSASVWSSLIEFKETEDDWADDDAGVKPTATRTRRLWPAVGAGLLVLSLLAMWTAGLARVKATNRWLVFDELPKPPEPRADRKKATVKPDGVKRPVELSVSTERHKSLVEEDPVQWAGDEANTGAGEEKSTGARLEPNAGSGLREMTSAAEARFDRTAAPLPGAETTNSAGKFSEIASFKPKPSDRVLQARLLPDGRHVLYETSGQDRSLWLGEVENPKSPRKLKGDHTTWVRLVLSEDGRLAVVVCADKTVWSWNLETDRSRRLRHESADFTPLAVSHDNRRIASVRGDTMQLCDLETGRSTPRKLRGQMGSAIERIVFGPDGRDVLSSHADHTIRTCDVDTGRLIRPPIDPGDTLSDVAVFSEGRRVMTSCLDGTVGVWELETGRQLRRMRGRDNKRVTAIAVSRDGRRALVGADRTFSLWDLETGEELYRDEQERTTLNVGFSFDGSRALLGTDETVRIFSLPPDRRPAERARIAEVAQFIDSTNDRAEMALVSPDGRCVLAHYWDKPIRLWDRDTGRLIGHIGNIGAGGHALAVSRDGRRVLEAASDRIVRLWDLKSGELVRDLKGHREYVFSVAFSPDGRRAYSASGGTPPVTDGSDSAIRVWDLAQGWEVGQLVGHKGIVENVAVSPDGRRVLSGGADKTPILWDAEVGRERLRLRGHTALVQCVAFLPDGEHAVSCSRDGTIRFWSLESGQEIDSFRGHEAEANWLAVSPDGHRMVSSHHWGHELWLWDVDARQQIARVSSGSVAPVRGSFAPDGRHVVWGGTDGIVRMYRLPGPDVPPSANPIRPAPIKGKRRGNR
jgi:WD40 repeat protein/serine/threonine protein kinase